MHRISSSVWNIEISTLHSYGKSGFVCLIKCSCERFQNLPKKQKKTLSVVFRFFWFSLLNFHNPEVYGKRSIWLKHFIKHIHLISEECLPIHCLQIAHFPLQKPHCGLECWHPLSLLIQVRWQARMLYIRFASLSPLLLLLSCLFLLPSLSLPSEVKACRFWYCLAFVCNFCSHH